MKKGILVTLALLFTSAAFASTTTLKQIDNIQNSTGGSSLSVPSTGTTLTTDTNTQTLTNKTLSGASNTFSNIPVSAIATGTALGVNAGGTGATTLTANGMVYGNGTSAVGVTAAGSQYQTFQAGASGVPTVGAVQLNQSAAISGTLPVGNGGTGVANPTSGSVYIGAGSSPMTAVAPGTSGNVLSSNGSTWVSSAPSSPAPNVVSTFASPSSITAAGGVSFSGTNSINYTFIVGSPGAVTVSASPQVAAGSVNGQLLTLVGTSATNTVKLSDGTGLALNGPWTGALSSSLTMMWDNGASVWREISRNN